jgi:hypothetical protein
MQGESLLDPPDIASDRMLVVSGFDAEVSSTGNGQGWQRAETTGRPFSERNEFRIIHCNASAEALFPELALVFTTLPGNPTANDCDRGAEKQRIQNAQVKLNALLQNTD